MASSFVFKYCKPEIVKELQVIHYGSSRFDHASFKNIQNYPENHARGGVKPSGGLWGSPSTSKYSWSHFCKSNDRKLKAETFSITFKNSAKIFLIDNYKDLENLPKRSNLRDVDWEKVSLYADAVWLTVKGLEETIISTPLHLCGWDCETILVMNSLCLEAT